MIIETNLNVGDEVFYLADNKITHSEITNIQITVNEEATIIKYTTKRGTSKSADSFHRTKKEAAIEWLQKQGIAGLIPVKAKL